MVNPTASDLESVGRRMRQLAVDLFPICRSITGAGQRQTLARIGQDVPLTQHALSSGTSVFDWTIPPEWNIRDAYIKNQAGERVVDFQANNLHVVNYSIPIHQRISRTDLWPRLHSLPDHPDWIPYRTTYYARDWGFCVSDRVKQTLQDDAYDVCIDSQLQPGVLTWGECVLQGASEQEYLFSAHTCHPSLANDNLSGIAVACELIRFLQAIPARRYTYRFLFMPGTIGTIAWLATNQHRLDQVRGGLVLALLGHNWPLNYKQTRQGGHPVDQAVAQALRDSGFPHEQMAFEPFGYDERQYNSPGIQLPVGCLMRSRYAGYPEYHTSADNLSRLQEERLRESWDVCRRVIEIWENDRHYRNTQPFGEPQLGKRGLYQSLGGLADRQAVQQALLWVLHLADGSCSLLQMAQRSTIPFPQIQTAAQLLVAHELLQECPAR